MYISAARLTEGCLEEAWLAVGGGGGRPPLPCIVLVRDKDVGLSCAAWTRCLCFSVDGKRVRFDSILVDFDMCGVVQES